MDCGSLQFKFPSSCCIERTSCRGISCICFSMIKFFFPISSVCKGQQLICLSYLGLNLLLTVWDLPDCNLCFHHLLAACPCKLT